MSASKSEKKEPTFVVSGKEELGRPPQVARGAFSARGGFKKQRYIRPGKRRNFKGRFFHLAWYNTIRKKGEGSEYEKRECHCSKTMGRDWRRMLQRGGARKVKRV